MLHRERRCGGIDGIARAIVVAMEARKLDLELATCGKLLEVGEAERVEFGARKARVGWRGGKA